MSLKSGNDSPDPEKIPPRTASAPYYQHLIDEHVRLLALRIFRILRAAVHKFLADHCFVRANAIAYSIVFSIIPLLAVMVQFAAVDREDIRANLVRFMAAYGLTDTTEILIFLDQVMSHARAISRAGAVIMIITATNLVFHLEDAFNYIYRAPSSRPLVYRFSIFISTLVLLPGLLLLSGGVFRQLTSTLKPPELRDLALAADGIWIASGDGTVHHLQEGSERRISLRSHVQKKTGFRAIYFDLKSGQSGRHWEILGEDNIRRKKDLDIEDFTSIKRIVVAGDRIYVLSETGALFFSSNSGVTWDYRLFRFKLESVRLPIMEDALLAGDGSLLVLATVRGKSCLLRRQDDDNWTLRPFDSVYHGIHEFPAAESDGNRSRIYVSGSGRYRLTEDGGKTWRGPVDARYQKRNIRINDMEPGPGNEIVLGGGESALWTLDGRRIFDLRSRSDQAVIGIHFLNEREGFVYGKNGLFRYTNDGGRTWLKTDDSVLTETTFLAHTLLPSGEILFVGENETVYQTTYPQPTTDRDDQGFPLARVKQRGLREFHFLKSVFLQFVLFSILFTLILAIFLLAYKFLPNAQVDWTPALVSSTITSTALVAFVLLFRLWILTFSSTTVIIYGVWAVVPVGMLIILTSTLIILFGLELAYVIQHPHLHDHEGSEPLSLSQSGYLYWNALYLTSLVYNSMYVDRRPLKSEQAIACFDDDLRTLERTRELLISGKIFTYDETREEYYPLRSPHETYLKDLQKIVFRHPLGIPPQAVHNAFRAKFLTVRKSIQEQMDRGADNLTIAHLLPLAGRTLPRKN